MRILLSLLFLFPLAAVFAQGDQFAPCSDNGRIMLCGMDQTIIMSRGDQKPALIAEITIYAANRTAKTQLLEVKNIAWTNGVRKEPTADFKIIPMGTVNDSASKKIKLSEGYSNRYVIQIPDGIPVYENHVDPQAFEITILNGVDELTFFAPLHMEVEFPLDDVPEPAPED